MYIMSNSSGSTLYTGVTNNLLRRVYEHKTGIGSKFVNKYKLTNLVYYELVDSIEVAITREKQLKAGSRAKKEALIGKMNPYKLDLYKTLL